jgi:predicted GNAT superfamily acetyltransferase
MITIRELREVRDLYALVDLQQAIWNMPAAECVSPHTMRAVTVNGGVVIGAFDEARVVGLCFAFPSKRGNQVMLWSFMTGVHPDYQGQGIGNQLKHAQRRWAEANGYSSIGWTYDPMQRGNANFNFNRLGIRVRRYYVDFYGEMADELNAGLASDRFEAEWPIDRKLTPLAVDMARIPFQLQRQEDRIVMDQASLEGSTCAVEIPFDLRALKHDNMELAVEWQLALREVMQRALAMKFVVVGFVNQPPRCWYVLRKEDE